SGSPSRTPAPWAYATDLWAESPAHGMVGDLAWTGYWMCTWVLGRTRSLELRRRRRRKKRTRSATRESKVTPPMTAPAIAPGGVEDEVDDVVVVLEEEEEAAGREVTVAVGWDLSVSLVAEEVVGDEERVGWEDDDDPEDDGSGIGEYAADSFSSGDKDAALRSEAGQPSWLHGLDSQQPMNGGFVNAQVYQRLLPGQTLPVTLS
ncbi:MAG: hypothetical protein Q9214_000734, partial [Letrouitia sp. 1 TL-2023]